MHFELQRGGFTISTDPDRLDLSAIHGFLSGTYWAQGVDRAIFERSVRHSLCFGLYQASEQIGFARVITDRATFGYLADVFILEPFRRRGLGSWLIESIIGHPDLRDCRKLALVTRDAHGLYTRFGFRPPARPGDYLERRPPGYRQPEL